MAEYPDRGRGAHVTTQASRVEVAILGGGPAGAAAAGLLARWGHRVALLTRPAALPAHAESLPPSCAKLFDRFGVREAVDAAGFVRATGNTVHWGGSKARVERFGGGEPGYQVRRDAFDRVLLAEAEAAGASVTRDATVHEVRLADDAPGLIRYDDAGGMRELAAHWVLDCTGRTGLIARRGWRRPEPGARTMAIIGAWERAGGWPGPDESHTVVESFDGGWGWSVPESSTRRLVTVMVDPSRTKVERGAMLEATYDAELARMRALPAFLDGATRVGRVWARDASSYSASQVSAPGVLLVGDAASFIDPLSSYGVKKALASAWLAAVVVRTVLADPTMLAPALELFERREREIYDALRRRLAAVSRDAVAGHASGFWEGRPMDEEPATAGEPDVAALRTDAAVLAAFEELRSRDSLTLSPSSALTRVRCATVQGDRVVLEQRLACPAFPEGIRHLRNVDLVRLVELAPRHRQVPDLYEAYARAEHEVALPDFLGALSVLVGKGMLELA